VNQVKVELEQLREATSGLDAHLKKHVHRQAEIEQELRDIVGQVDEEAGKRKSKEVLGRLKELAEWENTLQTELKEVRYLKVEIPRQVRENSQREEKLRSKVVKVEEKESNLKELAAAKTNKRKQIEDELSTVREAETHLKEQLALETETGNRLKVQLEELEVDLEQKEQELRSVTDELAELMSELDKTRLDEAQARLVVEKEEEQEPEMYAVIRDETVTSLVDEQQPASRGSGGDSRLPAV